MPLAPGLRASGALIAHGPLLFLNMGLEDSKPWGTGRMSQAASTGGCCDGGQAGE